MRGKKRERLIETGATTTIVDSVPQDSSDVNYICSFYRQGVGKALMGAGLAAENFRQFGKKGLEWHPLGDGRIASLGYKTEARMTNRNARITNPQTVIAQTPIL